LFIDPLYYTVPRYGLPYSNSVQTVYIIIIINPSGSAADVCKTAMLQVEKVLYQNKHLDAR